MKLFSKKNPNVLEATGSHVHGAKNVPLTAIMTASGLKTKDQIESALQSAGFKKDAVIVTACNGGVQASLLSLGLFTAGFKSKLYNVSPSF